MHYMKVRKKKKPSNMLCVFFLDRFIVFYLFGACFSSSKALSTSSSCDMKL
jgi:hypothetical protein